MPGAVRFVGFEGRANPIPEEQVAYVRRFLEASIAVDPYPYMQVGSRVEVIAGPLKEFRASWWKSADGSVLSFRWI